MKHRINTLKIQKLSLKVYSLKDKKKLTNRWIEWPVKRKDPNH